MLFSGKNTGIERIVVFLGNPGPEYKGTRHNAGYMAADEIEKKFGLRINRVRFQALTTRCRLGGKSVFLMKPLTYMNLSGKSVGAAAKYFRLPADRIIAVSDDVALPAGKLRIRRKGSDGGHNGLKSIISALGSEEFPRIKIGVGSPDRPEYSMIDWVLGRFSVHDSAEAETAIKKAAEAVETLIRDGADVAMSVYNGGE